MPEKKKTTDELQRRIKELESEIQRIKSEKASELSSFLNPIFTDSHIKQLILNPRTGKIVAANKATCDFYGYTHDEIIGMDISQINTLSYEKIKHELLNATVGQKKNYFNFEHKLRNGEIKQVEVQSWAIKIANEELLFSIIHDITKKKEVEEELYKTNRLLEDKNELLKNSEEKFYKIFNHNSVAMALSTIDEGLYINVNDEFLRLIERTRDEVVGHTAFELNLWMRPEELHRIVSEIKKKGSIQNLEIDVRTKSGKVINMLCVGELVNINNQPCLLISAYDITERKQAEEQLLALNYSISNAPFAAYWINKEGRFVYVNQVGCSMLGYTHDEMLKLNIWNVNAESSPDVWEQFWPQFKENKNYFSQSVHRKKDGTEFPVELISGYLIYGQHEYAVGYAIDITERKIGEELLKESEEKFRSIFMLGFDAFYIATLEGGIVEINKEFETTFGYQKHEVMGKTSLELNLYSNPRDREEIYSELDMKVMVKDKEIVGRKKNGELFFCLLSIRKILLNKSTHVVGIIKDISGIKNAENTIKESEAKFRALSENSLTGIYLMDDNHLKYVNPKLCEIFGYSKEELIGSNPLKLVHPNDHNMVKENMRRRLTGEISSMKYEFLGLRKDGELRNIVVLGEALELNGKYLLFGNILDITEQNLTHEALVESQTMIESVINSTEDFIWTVDPVNFGLQTYNAAYYDYSTEIRGIALRPGMTPDELVPPEKAIIWKEFYRNAINLGHYQTTYEVVSGTHILDLSLFKIVRENKTFGVSVFGRNITKMKQFEKDLILAKNKAEESDHLKTAFLHNISHEIRTPLNAIMGFSELLNKNDYEGEKNGQLINIILKSGEQLINIVDDILAISKIEARQEIIKEEGVNLNLLCKQLYNQFQLKSNQNLNFSIGLTLNDNEATIITDKTKLFQILSNLINNSFKFTKQGRIEYGYTFKSNFIEFYVKDSGIGIPSTMFEEIFQRFRQVEDAENRQYGGSGLGLSISRAYVELLGGKIWVTSDLGVGSTFYFTIPYNHDNIGENLIIKPETNREKLIWKNLTILIAEDEESNYQLLKELLKEFEPQILWAQNGREALELCKSNHHVQVVLMDLKMPIMDGFEATKQIRSLCPNLPIIAQSAYSENDDINKAINAGCNDFIGKPIHKNSLLLKIKTLISG